MAIKIAGSALKSRVGRVSGNTDIFFLGLIDFGECIVAPDIGCQSVQFEPPSEDSVQPGQPPSLIRVFAVGSVGS